MKRNQWPGIVERAGLLVSLTIVSFGILAGYLPSHVQPYLLQSLCVPFLLWAAFRFGSREVIVVVAMLSGGSMWGALRGAGPFAESGGIEEAWLLQAFVTVTSITGIALAAAVGGRRRAEQRLQRIATTDPLTGLVNYERLLDVLRAEMARSRRTGRSFALLLVDMDGLKAVNDRFGHLAGSRAICRVADALRGCTRETDVVSRFGGDEFALVLPESGDDGGSAVMGRVNEKLAADRTAPLLSVSGGYAVFPRDGDSPTLLLRAADRQLSAAKHGGETVARPELVELTASA